MMDPKTFDNLKLHYSLRFHDTLMIEPEQPSGSLVLFSLAIYITQQPWCVDVITWHHQSPGLHLVLPCVWKGLLEGLLGLRADM